MTLLNLMILIAMLFRPHFAVCSISNQRGFTLLEISIVLAVIGLLVGSVIGGTHIIKQSQLISVIAAVDENTAAVRLFDTQFGTLPGDLPNATSYWSTCIDGASPTSNTCNGDGNQSLNGTEYIRVFEHLSLAELVSSNYIGQGKSYPTKDELTPFIGYAIPQLRYSVSSVYAGLIYNTHTSYGRTSRGFQVGLPGKEADLAGVLNAIESSSLDIKFDDGVPHLGDIIVNQGVDNNGVAQTNCITENGDDTAKYDFATNAIECRLWFWNR